jgi:hypothetical protein
MDCLAARSGGSCEGLLWCMQVCGVFMNEGSMTSFANNPTV